MPISRQYISDHMFKRPHIKGTIFSDTMAGHYKSLDSNRYAQVFANNYFFADSYPTEKMILAGQGLREFIGDFGVMDHLVFYGSKEQTSNGTYFMK